MALTDIAIKNAKPGPKPQRLKDERGLFLEVRPNSSKWWGFRCFFGGKEKMISLGVYPNVTLKEARERRDEARKLLANGINPSEARKAEKAETQAEAITFELVARERHGKYKPTGVLPIASIQFNASKTTFSLLLGQDLYKT